MGNYSDRLRSLFRSSLKSRNSRNSLNINFYEWSCITSSPLCYFRLETFESFLDSSGIKLEQYERNRILSLGTCHITCYKGTKVLAIRGSYGELKSCIDAYNQSSSSSRDNYVQRPTLHYAVGDFDKDKSLFGDGVFFCT